jgi:hypothetical protein
MNLLISRILENKTRFYAALAAALIVIGWHLAVVARQPANWRKMATELGSVPQFRRERYIIANHANNCVIYNQDVENHVGFYFCNLVSGEKTFLCDRLKNDGECTYPFGWSTDDSLLIYSTLVEEKHNSDQKFVICDGKTGAKLKELQVDAGFGSVVWLSPRSFAYGAWSDLVIIEQRPDGTWVKKKTIPGILRSASCLTAVSENSVAWQEPDQEGVNQMAYKSSDQEWMVTLIAENQYEIAKTNGLALTAADSKAQLVLLPYAGTSNQLWTFTPNEANYNIMNVGSGENIDDWSGRAGTIVGQYTQDKANVNQQWKLTRVGDSRLNQPTRKKAGSIANGSYEISCPAGGDFAISYSGAGIRQIDINSGIVAPLWQSPTNRLIEFTYSSESGQYLLNCLDTDGQYLIRYNPFTGLSADAGRVANQTTDWIRNITWENHLPRYAYLNEDGLGSFEIKADAGTNLFQLPWHGGVTQYALYGDDLFVTGNPENEFPGIWHYNLKSKSLDCGPVESLARYQYSKRVPPIPALTTNSLGQEVGYYVWPPADVVPGKKHPIILTQTVNEWLPYQEAAANAGYYFVIARRSVFHNDRMQNWDDDVMSVYKALTNQTNINIDTNQMYLWGRCGETDEISRLLDANPALWKGLIFFDPSGLPNLEELRQKRIFIITGREAENARQLLDYQTKALAMGVPVKLILQDHIGHLSMSVATERARTIWFTEFLLQSK